MIPVLRINDAVRSIMSHELKGPNLACSIRGCSPPQEWGIRGLVSRCCEFASLWKDAVLQGHDRVTQVWRDGPHLAAVASARILGGPKAWEIDHLYLRGTHSGIDLRREEYAAFLDGLVQSAKERGAERVFLKCLSSSEISKLAQRAGFFNYLHQSLLEGHGSGGLLVRDDASKPIRARLPQDTHGLFQLYTATTPQQVRVGLGFTLDQWRDAQDPRRGCEWIVDHNDRLAGWAALWSHGADSHGEVMIHPDHRELLPEMIEWVLAQPGYQKWLVPHYQEPIQELLLRKGFRVSSEFVILAKTVVAQEVSHRMAAVEA